MPLLTRLLCCGLILGLAWGGVVAPLAAQQDENPDALSRLLTTSIDPATGLVSLLWAELDTGGLTPITNFNSVSYCEPELLPEAGILLYEPAAAQPAYVYQIDLAVGSILPFPGAAENGWRCPKVSPAGVSIAWLHDTESTQQLIMTDLAGGLALVFAEHSAIYDVMWSPDGEVLIYTAVDEDETFRPLYAHSDAQQMFWGRDQGLVQDYVWLPDGSALLLANYTQDAAVLGRLSRDCVQQGGCSPEALAEFPLESSLLLADAFAPDQSAMLLIEESPVPEGEGQGLQSTLYVVQLETGRVRPLNASPGLVKTSPVWLPDGRIYFVGTHFDTASFTYTHSAVFQVEGDSTSAAIEQPGYYPAQILAWE